MKKQAKKVVEKTKSVWDWKGKPSLMADDKSQVNSFNGAKGRRIIDPFPPHMQTYKESK